MRVVLEFRIKAGGRPFLIETDAETVHPTCVLDAEGSVMSPGLFMRALDMVGLRDAFRHAVEKAGAKR